MMSLASRTFEIVNKRGLHARASSRFVTVVCRYDAAIEVEKDGVTVGGTSIMGLMMLAAGAGSHITVRASGPDANTALDALGTLIADRFGEEI